MANICGKKIDFCIITFCIVTLDDNYAKIKVLCLFCKKTEIIYIISYISYIAVAMPSSVEDGREIIQYVDDIIKDPTTIHGTPGGIGENDVIIVIRKSDGTIDSYTIAKYVPGGVYPLIDERNIHHEQTRNGTNQLTSPDGVCWVIEGTQSFHDPYNTTHPYVLVDRIHIIILQLPNVRVNAYMADDNDNDSDYGADDDGESWDEGSVVSEGGFSEADTDSVVSENGDGDNGYESIDEIQRILPTNTITYIRQTMTIALLTRYVNLLRAFSEKKRWVRWYVFFANGNRLHTRNDELLHVARILKFAVWTCSQHSGIFEGMSYDDCVKLIVNAICKE